MSAKLAAVKLCWCRPVGSSMGSPGDEPERRRRGRRFEVTLTKGFGWASSRRTQGQWKRIMERLPGELTTECPKGDDYPVATSLPKRRGSARNSPQFGRQSGNSRSIWEFRRHRSAVGIRLPGRDHHGHAFGISSAATGDFKGKPYNGGRAAITQSCPPSRPLSRHTWAARHAGNIFELSATVHAKLPGGVDPDLYYAKSTALKIGPATCRAVRRGGLLDR